MLAQYRASLQREVAASVAAGIPNDHIRAAAVDAVTGGKMARSSIVVDMAAAMRGETNSIKQGLHLAIAIECIHAASLVLDDFAEFDDERERRGKASLHVAHGRPASMLASVALFAHAARCVAKQRHLSGDSAACDMMEATVEAVQDCADGQLKEVTGEVPLEVIVAKKTGALFQLAFVGGWMAGGGATERIPEVVDAGLRFGAMWQVMDDAEDVEQDAAEGSRNMVLERGVPEAGDAYLAARAGFVGFLRTHGLNTPFMTELVATMDAKTEVGLAAAL